jgi:hypothetical protein
VRIWENSDYYSYAHVLPQTVPGARNEVIGEGEAVAIERTSSREMYLNVTINEPSVLVISETYLPGWRAYARHADDSTTKPCSTFVLSTAISRCRTA